MSTALQPTPSPAGHRPLHWAPVGAAAVVVLALLLALTMVPPAADEAPQPDASVGAAPARAGVTPLTP